MFSILPFLSTLFLERKTSLILLWNLKVRKELLIENDSSKLYTTYKDKIWPVSSYMKYELNKANLFKNAFWAKMIVF